MEEYNFLSKEEGRSKESGHSRQDQRISDLSCNLHKKDFKDSRHTSNIYGQRSRYLVWKTKSPDSMRSLKIPDRLCELCVF